MKPTVWSWIGVAGAVLVLAPAFQVVAGWPLSPRNTGPALLALTIVTATGCAVAAGTSIGSGGASTSGGALLAALTILLTAGGLWLGAREGLLALTAACIAVAVQPGRGPAGRAAAAVAALALAVAAWRGPF